MILVSCYGNNYKHRLRVRIITYTYELCYLCSLKLSFLFDLYCAKMSQQTPWKRKNLLKDKEKWMRETKVQKQQDTTEEQQELSEGPHSSVDLNESVIFLAPSTIIWMRIWVLMTKIMWKTSQ